MRNILTAVVLAACAGLVACGGGDDGEKKTGGTGGGGGGGGEETSVCGDGVVEGSEACDDGNTFDGDGCSSDCRIEGATCDLPLNFNVLSALDTQNNIRSYAGTLRGTESTFAASCGPNDGEEVFFTYQASHDGTLYFAVNQQDEVVVSVLGTCGGGELGCIGNRGAGVLEVEKNEVLIFVVDSPHVSQKTDFTLAMRLVPLFEEGELCPAPDVDPEIFGRCADGLRCDGNAGQRRCVPNNPPTIETASASWIGNDLRVTVTGGDPDGDAVGAEVDFVNASGQTISFTFGGRQFTTVLVVFNPAVTGRTAFEATGTFANLFSQYPELRRAVKANIRVRDSAAVTSPPLLVDLIRPPLVDEGASCDPTGVENRCPDDQRCANLGEGPVCATIETVRLDACGDAPAITLGAPLAEDITGGAESLWEPPASCLSFDYPGGMPEQVIRLSLEESVSRLTITTESEGTRVDTILYVYAGCGETNGAPLACNDDIDVDSDMLTSQVELTNVAAGEYLIVVDSWPAIDGSTGGPIEVTVSVQ